MSEPRGLKLRSGGVLNSEAFLEASKEELRVLVAVMERPFEFSTAEALSEAAGVSRARAASAIALFCEAGIFVREGDVSYEFERRSGEDEIIERTSHEVAEHIRKKELCSLFSDLAAMMGRDALNTDEIKRINSLIADEGLSEEYILNLSAYLLTKGDLAVNKIVRRAGALIKLEIDTTDALEEYIKAQGAESGLVGEFRSTFGKWRGNVTRTELDFYRKWTDTYGFLPEVILLAQDINVIAKNDYSYAYMDTLLTRWHECGCKSLEDCKRQAEEDRVKIAEQRQRENSQRKAPPASKSKAPEPKYGDFDPNEALERALARSYAKYAEDGSES